MTKDGTANNIDTALALAVDESGNIFVTGKSLGTQTASDFATIMYDADGSQIWVARYNGPGNGADVVYSLAVDSSSNIYIWI